MQSQQPIYEKSVNQNFLTAGGAKIEIKLLNIYFLSVENGENRDRDSIKN